MGWVTFKTKNRYRQKQVKQFDEPLFPRCPTTGIMFVCKIFGNSTRSYDGMENDIGPSHCNALPSMTRPSQRGGSTQSLRRRFRRSSPAAVDTLLETMKRTKPFGDGAGPSSFWLIARKLPIEATTGSPSLRRVTWLPLRHLGRGDFSIATRPRRTEAYQSDCHRIKQCVHSREATVRSEARCCES